jgi:NADPH-dependent ferric siderophore reductase
MSLKQKILDVVGDRFLHLVRVAEVNAVSERFRYIDLEAEAFTKVVFRPGEKIQLNAGDWNVRTYTPLALDPSTGRLGILAYLHGNGPGSNWGRTVKPGDTSRVLGPRPSLKTSALAGAAVWFGDETSVAAATTLKRSYRNSGTRLIFEASHPEELRAIVRDLGLDDAEVYGRAKDESVSEDALAALQRGAELSTREIILTGRAQSIQQARARLKFAGIDASRLVSKAYWSEGRAGLD